MNNQQLERIDREQPSLDSMTPAERLAAYRAGRFSPHQRALWATHYPGEPPVINGELEWIAMKLADLD